MMMTMVEEPALQSTKVLHQKYKNEQNRSDAVVMGGVGPWEYVL